MIQSGLNRSAQDSIRWIEGSRLLSSDYESTVDGVHYTDRGFHTYVEEVLPLLKQLLEE